MTPALDRVDHIHIYVDDRPAAENWYREIFGLRRKPELESWAVGPGPLMLENETGSIVLALFEKAPGHNKTTVAFGVTGETLLAWKEVLSAKLDKVVEPVDYGKAWSLYISDPWGNPYEITTYDYDFVKSRL